jgi:hypothetical protein
VNFRNLVGPFEIHQFRGFISRKVRILAMNFQISVFQLLSEFHVFDRREKFLRQSSNFDGT